MTIRKPLLSVLTALYRLRQNDLPINVTTLAITTGNRRAEVACLLDELDRLGLVDSCRLRPTMSGLVVAGSHLARRSQQPVAPSRRVHLAA